MQTMACCFLKKYRQYSKFSKISKHDFSLNEEFLQSLTLVLSRSLGQKSRLIFHSSFTVMVRTKFQSRSSGWNWCWTRSRSILPTSCQMNMAKICLDGVLPGTPNSCNISRILLITLITPWMLSELAKIAQIILKKGHYFFKNLKGHLEHHFHFHHHLQYHQK